MAVAISGLDEIAAFFNVFIFDQWGVLHDGYQSYEPARQVLNALARQNKTVILLSNTALDGRSSAQRLARLGITADLYTRNVTSGDHFAAWWNAAPEQHCDEFGAGYLLASGPSFVPPVCEGLTFTTDMHRAGFCIVAGINFGRWADNGYDPELELARKLSLPLICINPDQGIPGPDGVRPGPGRIAQRYAGMGGSVVRFGKPDPDIFDFCLDGLGAEARCAVLMVGDTLHTDILGGQKAGIPTLLIGSGIHAGEIDQNDWASSVTALAESAGAYPSYAMRSLTW